MGGESVFRPFMLMLGVMALFGTISVTLIQAMTGSAQNINGGIDKDNYLSEIIGSTSYTLIDPDTGYSITTAMTKDHMVHPKDATIVFTDADHSNDKKYVQIIRNNANFDANSTDIWKKYKDFITVQRETGALWSAKWNGAVVSFESIVSHFDWKTNTSVVGFEMSGWNDTLFIHLAVNNTALIWNNAFTLYYGWSTLRAGKVDLWGTIGMILTAQIPGLNDRVQFILTSFWLVSLIFVGYVMISRIIPFISGG